MLRKYRGSVLAGLMFLGAASAAQAQAPADKNIAWDMAFLKGDFISPAAQDLTKPIDMKTGDKFQLYVQAVDSQAYLYVLFRSVDGAVDVLGGGLVPENAPEFLPSQTETYSITPPGGTEMIYVVVTASRQQKLEKLMNKAKKDPDAVLDEVKRIQQSVSTAMEIPQKPVPIGGVFRSGQGALQATRFEGRQTYVQIIRIRH